MCRGWVPYSVEGCQWRVEREMPQIRHPVADRFHASKGCLVGHTHTHTYTYTHTHPSHTSKDPEAAVSLCPRNSPDVALRERGSLSCCENSPGVCIEEGLGLSALCGVVWM
eukprot:scaffold222623_cov14-Tisochrysis_lutea.AAC.1